MANGPIKRTISPELRAKLLDLAVQTDLIAEHPGVDTWRMAAVSAARWLLRAAAESEDIPKGMNATLRQIASAANRMSNLWANDEKRTKSGELRLELAKFLDDDDV